MLYLCRNQVNQDINMNSSYDEREVLALLQDESTQRKGFEMIVAQYSEQLYWQIRRMVLSHEDANDLLQNTFIKAWTSIDYFRGDAKLSTWLYRIALNECLTFGPDGKLIEGFMVNEDYLDPILKYAKLRDIHIETVG